MPGSRSKRVTRLAVLGLVLSCLVPASAAAAAPTELTRVCATIGNGQLRDTATGSCKRNETLVLIAASNPIRACVSPIDSRVRMITLLSGCAPGDVSLTLPSAKTTSYFCAKSDLFLRYVTSPSQCVAKETAFVVTRLQQTPVVTTSSGSTAYTENATPVAVDSALTVTDPDSANLASAAIQITSGYEPGDALHFSNQSGITGSWNVTTGKLTLSGSSTVASYQTALRSVTFDEAGDAPAAGRTLTFTANDGSNGSAGATKAIAITAVNDAPTVSATGGSLSYNEGDGAQVLDAGVSVTDPDSAQLSGATVQITGNFVGAEDDLGFSNQNGITGSYDDTSGKLTLSGPASVANYVTALQSVTYTNSSDNPSTAVRTVSIQATDSASAASNTATRGISLTGANDGPTVTTSTTALSYTEGDSARTIDNGLTVSDPDDTSLAGATVKVLAGFQSGDELVFSDQNGITGSYNADTLTLTGTSSVANYQTALRSVGYRNTGDNPGTSRTIEFRASDPSAATSAPATRDIAVTPVNDTPVVSTTGTTLSYTEGDGARAVDGGITVSDPDDAQLTGAVISISGNYASGEDTLAFANTATITGAYDSSSGTLTLSGTDTVANYQAALRSVTYSNSSENPSTATRTASFKAMDGSGPAHVGNPAMRDVSVARVNDAPVLTATAGSTAYTEGDPGTTIDSGLTATDADDTNVTGGQVRISSGFQSGDDLVFVNGNGISGVYNTGTGVLTLSGTSSLANYQSALRSIKFQSTQDAPVTPKTIEFKVRDGSADSNTPTKEIAVTPVNDPPQVTSGGTFSYTENDAATAVHSGLTVTEPEGNDLGGASASITANYQAGEDFLSWTDNNLADKITKDSVNSTAQTVLLTGVDSAANYQAALRAVKYRDSSDAPSTLNRTVTFSATDTPGGATGSGTRTVSVQAVDDPPLANNDAQTVDENSAATAIAVFANDTDVDGGTMTISSATDPAHGTVVLTGGSAGARTGLTYQPDAGYCNNPPGSSPDTFDYTLNGGSTATVSMTVNCVNQAPVATDDTFNGGDGAIGNTTLNVNDPSDVRMGTPDPTDTSPVTNRPHKEISGDILANDSDADTPGSQLTVTPGAFATNDGGTVTIQSDGDFNFEPAPSTSCTDHSDFFDYTVSDNVSSGGGPTPGTDTGRVTVAITGCVWYVNNKDAEGNSGTSERPFDTLAQAQTASGTGDSIFVYDGDGTTTGYAAGISLKSSQKLIGEAADLVVGSETLHSAVANHKPSLTNNNADVVTLAGGTTVKGLKIDPQGTGGGVYGTALGATTVTLDGLNIVDTDTKGTEPGLELEATSGTTTNVSNLTVNNGDGSAATATDRGVRLNNAGTVNFASSGTISITTNGAAGLTGSATGLGSASTFDDITVTNSGSGGVDLQSMNGSGTAFGDGNGTDLSLTTTQGSTAAFSVQSAGIFDVPAGGQSDISATGGPAVDVANSVFSTMAFDSVSSTNSANDGINIDTIGSGTFSASSGTIGGEAGIGFDLNGGSGNVTYPGTFNDGSGLLTADVTGRSGGTVSLSGNMSDTNDTGGGVNLASNTGGSTTLSGATKQFNTGAGDAVLFNNSNGHTLSLTGGGLDVDTTSGKGLEASSSGTLAVTGSGNTVDTGTGRAVNILGTAIGAGNVTLQQVSSAGAPGSVVSSTGSNGKFRITGTGSADSGGAIANATGNGLTLSSTAAPEISQLDVNDAAAGGVSVSNSGGASLDHVDIRRAGGSGLGLGGAGDVSMTGGSVVDSTSNNSIVVTTSGAGGTLTFDGVTMHGSGFGMFAQPSGPFNLVVKNSTIENTTGIGIWVAAQSASGSTTEIADNTFRDNRQHLDLQMSSSGPDKFDIHGNTMLRATSNAVQIGTSYPTIDNDPADGGPGRPKVDGRVRSNTIGTATAGSGGPGYAVHLNMPGDLDGRLAITDNAIQNTLAGFNVDAFNDGPVAGDTADSLTGLLDLIVSGNTFAHRVTGNGFPQGVRVNALDTFAVCADIFGNSVDSSWGGYRVEQNQNSTFKLDGYGGNPTDLTAVNNFLTAQNISGTGVSVANNTGFVGVPNGTCQGPNLP